MTMMSNTAVLCLSWSRSGQLTRLSSPRTSLTNLVGPASTPPPLLCGCCCDFLLDPFAVAGPRFLPIVSSHGFASRSRAGGTRTHDLRFWRPLLYQLSYCPLSTDSTGSPGAPYDGGTTGNTSVAGCDPGCSAGSSGCGSSGACTRRKPALPIVAQLTSESQGRRRRRPRAPTVCYSTISVTTPAPTVLPPSLMAKFNPSSMAIGEINSTFITVLSPGITISTPSSRRISPVTSVVLK